MFLADSTQIREADRIQIEEKGFPGILLMESAGRQSATIILKRFPHQKNFLILAGPGNNGGDGLVIARYLHLAGKVVHVLLSHRPDRYKGDALINYQVLRQFPVPVGIFSKEEAEKCLGQFWGRPILIDALLGTGIQSKLRPPISKVIRFFKRLTLKTIAIDLVSGLDADTGEIINEILPAIFTLTFQLPKICHYITPAANYGGEVITIDIGLWPTVIQSLGIKRHLITDQFVKEKHLIRPNDGHKGTFGHALLIGGSVNMAGAIAMTTYATVHAGAGLCTVITPKSCQAAVNALCPEAMCIGLQNENADYLGDSAFGEIQAALTGKSVVLLGPGMGQTAEGLNLMERLLKEIAVPLIIDADGLNYLSTNPILLELLKPQTILTPHPGEMKRLSEDKAVNQKRLALTEAFSQKHQCITLLKGAGSIIALPSGETYVNTSGNPGMATGGSGDVLTGIIGGLIAQGYSLEAAVPLAVYLHGKTGDVIASEVGEAGVTAMGMARNLGRVWMELLSRSGVAKSLI